MVAKLIACIAVLPCVCSFGSLPSAPGTQTDNTDETAGARAGGACTPAPADACGDDYILLPRNAIRPCDSTCGYSEVSTAKDCKASVVSLAEEISQATGKTAAYKGSRRRSDWIEGCVKHKTHKILFNRNAGSPQTTDFQKICKLVDAGAAGCVNVPDDAGGEFTDVQAAVELSVCGQGLAPVHLPYEEALALNTPGMCYSPMDSCPCNDYHDEAPRGKDGGCPVCAPGFSHAKEYAVKVGEPVDQEGEWQRPCCVWVPTKQLLGRISG